jgi:predicted component of type VI protein secretion system
VGFRLRHREQDLALGDGDFLIGRTAECDLPLENDPSVSRRHAVFHVAADDIVVEDLGSRNGVLLNGQRVIGRAKVRAGDKVRVGSQELHVIATGELLASTLAAANAPTAKQVARVILKRMAEDELDYDHVDTKVTVPRDAAPDDTIGAKKLDAFRVLASVAEKALVMGRADEAERMLATPLAEVLSAAGTDKRLHPPLAEQAACVAAKLATATAKGSWIDYAIELYATLGRPAPAVVIDELMGAFRRVTSADVGRLNAYVDALRAELPTFGPADRFLLQRLEGLGRLATRRS